MRSRVAGLVALAVLCSPASASAAPTPPASPSLKNVPHAFKRSCAKPTGRRARCHAIVATAPDGGALPLAAPAGYGPGSLQSAYPLGSATLGTGKTVAIVDAYDNPNAEANLSTYRSTFGLPSCTTANGCFKKVNQTGGSTPPAGNVGWGQEIALDLDMVSAMCPNCKILLVEASSNSFSNLAIAENYAATHADVVSNSFGGNEFSTETSPANASPYDHPGIPITVSSGDDGYGVEFPAASPSVTAVGGTSLNADTNSRGWTETAWSGAGSGCSAYVSKPGWQHDLGCARRTVADVSAIADPNTGVAVYDTYGSSGWLVFGGTSVAAPVVAAGYALIGTTARDYFYTNAASLYDVVSGSNGSCGGTYLCTAMPGFDGPTGLGTFGLPLVVGPPPPPPPTASTGGSSAITLNTATISGSVNPNGADTTYHFEYGTSTSYGTSIPVPDAGAGNGTSPVAESANLTGLTQGTTYHYRIVATSANGTSTGGDATFTTTSPLSPPTATTNAATNIANRAARLNATVNPNGHSTTYHFEYGTSTNYGSSTPNTSAGSGTSNLSVSFRVTSLARHTTYHFRVVATSSDGTATGLDRTFTTT